jgi:hypothetical protein
MMTIAAMAICLRPGVPAGAAYLGLSSMVALNYRMSLASPTSAPPGKFAALKDPGFRNFVLLSGGAALMIGNA